jgi:DNA modification methylase
MTDHECQATDVEITKPLRRLVGEFESIVGLPLRMSAEFLSAANSLATYLSARRLRPLGERRQHLLAAINSKFETHSDALAAFYRIGAERGYTFNFHQKNAIQRAFDYQRLDELEAVLVDRKVDEPTGSCLRAAFIPLSPDDTLAILRNECADPSRLRREVGVRDIAAEILQSVCAAFLFSSLPQKDMHQYFDAPAGEDYSESFWSCLHSRNRHLFNREHALEVLRVDQRTADHAGDLPRLRNNLASRVAEAYRTLNNHCILAIVVEPIRYGQRFVQWELVANLTLFAEKHRDVELHAGYFRPKDIAENTKAHIADLRLDECRFELAQEGFTYLDCFALAPSDAARHVDLSALLLFQKNDRDQTPIPCPACRSLSVRGNSYPSLGVRSWECHNPLCPDRTKYNRGKRYSFKSLVMQQAIEDERNYIPPSSVRGWARDVQYGRTLADVLSMLLSHYSLYGDHAHLYNWPRKSELMAGRVLHHHALRGSEASSEYDLFLRSPMFSRYAIRRAPYVGPASRNLGDDAFTVLLGDAHAALTGVKPGMFDGAVTSPPYYNAREYSQWPNIYCYLYDMYNVAREVFRCLTPGALYLYNVFDYFDNERSVVFSAMGQKRMMLSAYTVDLFTRIGFECCGNVVWDKGEIEGKRGFNAGNFSPYYQAPFNCWEHVLLFRKPGKKGVGLGDINQMPGTLQQKPVMKMVNGKNTHGHSAPYPDAIPMLLCSMLDPGTRVLDPFAGSLTTGRVAEKCGLASTCVEQHEEYCRLGLRLRSVNGECTGPLFVPVTD